MGGLDNSKDMAGNTPCLMESQALGNPLVNCSHGSSLKQSQMTINHIQNALATLPNGLLK